mmetsp:Transcript_41659/g.76250  ORF Transcript_41659/g.76250 Transcript_41659/m.76250 type:complete len:80 (+) Transcript_41659:780-1019(+)
MPSMQDMDQFTIQIPNGNLRAWQFINIIDGISNRTCVNNGGKGCVWRGLSRTCKFSFRCCENTEIMNIIRKHAAIVTRS